MLNCFKNYKFVKILLILLTIMVSFFIIFFVAYHVVKASSSNSTTNIKLNDSIQPIEVQITNETESLKADETNSKIIIKKINKHNEDGTYTIGYEANDGTFKYESKDVLGNVKGTYGYIDEHGEIKRFSYNLNETESKGNVEDITPKKQVSSTTTKKPLAIVYPSSTRSPVVQSVTRKKLSTTSTTQQTPTSSKPYAYYTKVSADVSMSVATPNSNKIIYTTSTPSSTTKSEIKQEVSTARQESDGYYSKVLGSRPSEETKSTLENLEEKEIEKRPPKSNTIRRQLNPDFKHSDVDDIYGNSATSETQRPLFTSTQGNRQIQRQIYRPKFLPVKSLIRDQKLEKEEENLQEATTQASISSEEPYQSQNNVPVVQAPENVPNHILRSRHRLRNPEVENENEYGSNNYDQDHQYPKVNYRQNQGYTPYRVQIPLPPPEYGYSVNPPQQNYPLNYNYNPAPIASYPQNNDAYHQEDIYPPLTVRDFQRLLQQLIYVQLKLQQLAHLQNLQQRYYPVPRPQYPIRDDYRVPNPLTNSLTPINNPSISQINNPLNQLNYPISNLNYPNYLDSGYNKPQSEYLPPEVREMLLLKMLQLAINSEIAATNQMDVVTPPSMPKYLRKVPARNVKIVGEVQETKSNNRNKRFDDETIDNKEVVNAEITVDGGEIMKTEE